MSDIVLDANVIVGLLDEGDSFSKGILDHPHYTRPSEYRGMEVPAVLLSGDHGEVDAWRRKEALRKTRER